MKNSKKVSNLEKSIRENVTPRYYHWWDEPDELRLPNKAIKKWISRILKEEIQRARSYHDLIVNKKGLSEGFYTVLMKHLRGEHSSIKVRILKMFCNQFKRTYEEVEKFMDKFPIDLNSIEVQLLKTHMMNEGYVGYYGPKHSWTSEYINQDPVLVSRVYSLAKKAGFYVSEPHPKHGGIRINFDGITSRILHKAGIQYGNKVINQPELDEFLIKHDNLWREHVRITLTEEGSISLSIKENKTLYMRIVIQRAVDVTDLLPRKFVRSLKHGHHQKRNIRNDIIETINTHPPKLLIQEWKGFIYHHPQTKIAEPYLDKIGKSKDGRVSAYWNLNFTNPNSIDLIHEYGFLKGTWKALRFEKLYSIYKKLRGKKLSDIEIKEVKRVKDRYPARIPRWWIIGKVRELFPEAKWINDQKKILAIISRKRENY